ncbi:hypothetical protein B0H19DRAFT_1265447 [Mycena capillaripes]|nr:hypothetical protein B0H19DRAFT_1265447 [Mycena capillaripes]
MDRWATTLINWKDSVHLVFHQCSTAPGMAVVPGHVILAGSTPDPPHRPVLMVYTLASLATHWRPFTARRRSIANGAFDLHRIQQGFGVIPALIERPGTHAGWQDTGLMGMRLTLRVHPLRRDSCALTFVVSDRGTVPERYPAYADNPGALLVTYRVSVSVSPRQKLQLVQTSVVSSVHRYKAHDVSYARYTTAGHAVEDVERLGMCRQVNE